MEKAEFNTLLAELFEKEYQGFVKSVQGRAGTPEGAEDVVQEAFTRALRSQRGFKGNTLADLKGWLVGILQTASIDYANAERKQGMAKDALDGADDHITPLMEDAAITQEQVTVILEEMSTYPPEHTEALGYFFVEGFSASEVADVLPLNVNTIKSLCGRFRLKMQERYGVEFGFA